MPKAPVPAPEPIKNPPAINQVPPPAEAKPEKPALPGESPLSLAEIIEQYDYQGGSKRDPFLPYISGVDGLAQGPLFPLQKFEITDLKLIGIIWNTKKPKAMILDPVGMSYVVSLNDKIGRNNGYIAKIREGEVVVVEGFSDAEGRVSYQTKFLRLNSEK